MRVVVDHSIQRESRFDDGAPVRGEAGAAQVVTGDREHRARERVRVSRWD